VTLSASEPAVPAVEAKFVAADYIAAFGDTGARWFCEGKSFAKSAAEFVAKLRDDHKADVEAKAAQFKSEKDALQAEIDGLKAKLTGAPRGDQGVTFSNGDGNHDDAAAKFAPRSATTPPALPPASSCPASRRSNAARRSAPGTTQP
jgi:hypothetical protein